MLEEPKKRGPGRPRKVVSEDEKSESTNYSFGGYIRTLRESKSLSLTNAAKKMDMTVRNLCDIESGRRNKRFVSIELVQKVSKAYDTSIADIIRNTQTAVHNNRTMMDVMTELLPATRLAELVSKKIVDMSSDFPKEFEDLATELLGYVQNIKVLVALINNRHLTVEDKKPLFAEMKDEQFDR